MHEITSSIPNEYWIRGYSSALVIRHGPLADYVAALEDASARIDELANNPIGDVLVVITAPVFRQNVMRLSPDFLLDVQFCAAKLHPEMERMLSLAQAGG